MLVLRGPRRRPGAVGLQREIAIRKGGGQSQGRYQVSHSMLIGRIGTLAAVAACFLFVAACTPTAEGTREDQKNPFYLAGKERVQSMDYTGAVESFEKSLQENPRSVLAHFELGLVHEQHLGDYAAALYHYNKALKLR